MLVKAGLLISISVFFSILLMFFGYIAQNKVMFVSFFIALASLSFAFLEDKASGKKAINNDKSIFQ